MRPRLGCALVASLASIARPAHAEWTSVGANGDSLITPSIPPIAFFWSTYNDNLQTIPQCGGFQVATYNNSGSVAKPVPPFYFTAFPIGMQPAATSLGSTQLGEWFTWTAAYPIGTQLSLAMTDSANHSGGLVDGFTIIPGYDNCTVIKQDVAPTVSFSAYPENNACDEIVLRIKGGEGPFTISVLAGQSGQFANVTDHQSRTVKLRNTVPAGQTFHLFVTDANGVSSAVSSAMTSSLHLNGCATANPPTSDSSTPVGAIVGGVVGGLAGAVALALFAWWLIKRHRRKQEEERTLVGAVPAGRKRSSFAASSSPGGATQIDDGDSPQHSGSYDHHSFKYPLPVDAGHYYAIPTPLSATGPPLPLPASYDSSALQPYPHGYDPYGSSQAVSFAASSGAQAVEGGAYDSFDPMSAVSHTGSATSGSRAGTYDPNVHTYLHMGGSSRPPASPIDEPLPASSGIEELARPEEFEYRMGDSPTRTQQYASAPWHQVHGQPAVGHGVPYGFGAPASAAAPPPLHSQSSQGSMMAPPTSGSRLYP